MSSHSAIEFWARLADDEGFRLRFMAVDPGSMPEFLRKEGFDFAMDELASVVAMRSKFGTASLSKPQAPGARLVNGFENAKGSSL